MDLNQTGGTVTGTHVISGAYGARGNISGAVDAATFTGTLTMSTPSASGTVVCQGTASVSGTASTGTMRWTSPGVAQTNCNNMPVSITIAVQKR